MFGKPKPTVNVDEAVAALMKYAEQDEMFAALLKSMMAQTAVRMQAMTKAWIEELKKKGAPPEMIAAVTALQNMDVARKVRELVLKK
ncbi:MAG: hypothetical protein FD146_2424 [Anaerolineaceae bacterium]|nr:MAG: hypothetical protein FD146_2424 [Anaerolineaceae bacterium]